MSGSTWSCAGPLVFFGIWRIVYSLIERRDKWFVLLECISSCILIGAGRSLLAIPNVETRAILEWLLFVATGLAPRFIVPRHPLEAGGTVVDSDQGRVPVGIIDFTWMNVMGGALGGIYFVIGVASFVDIAAVGYVSPDYLQSLRDATVFLLDKTIDSVFLLGGVLAGCMAILWAGELWRKRGKTAHAQYKATTVTATKMVVAFFIVAAGVFIWVLAPLYKQLLVIVEATK